MRRIKILNYVKDKIVGSYHRKELRNTIIYENGLARTCSGQTDEYIKTNWNPICRPWAYYTINRA